MRHASIFVAATAALALIGAGPASAKPKQCRDASGHFITCPAEKTAAATSTKCRDAKGAFTKCPAGASTTGGTAAATTTTTTTTTTTAKAAKSSKAGKSKTTAATAAASAPAAGSNTAATAAMPAGAVTARCKDGTVSHSQHRSGTCARHGGVAAWM